MATWQHGNMLFVVQPSGMTSSAILTEEQKKARFRKSLQRKGQPPRDDDSDAFSGDHSSEAMTPFPHQPEEEKIDPPQTGM